MKLLKSKMYKKKGETLYIMDFSESSIKVFLKVKEIEKMELDLKTLDKKRLLPFSVIKDLFPRKSI